MNDTKMIVHVKNCDDQLCLEIENLPPCNLDSTDIKLHISTIDCGGYEECSENPVERRENEYCWNKGCKDVEEKERFTIEYIMLCFKDDKLCFKLDKLFLDKTPARYDATIIVDDVCIGEFQIQLEVAKIKARIDTYKDCESCD